uniref:Protein binding protein n=1 Tax=Zea mays TaxID=4577 RepID=B6SWQ3_MAIZE|nr:protein binding protein [Zea mays]
MAKLSCFPALLPGKRKKKTRKITDAIKASGNECPKVKPVEVELIDPTLGAGVVQDVVPAELSVPVEDRDNKEAADQLVSVKESDLSDFDFSFHAAKKPVRSDSGVALDTSADAAVADTSPKLKRSCSNIETKRPGSRSAPEMPARSRSYGDLGNLVAGLALDATATPHGAPEASPASVKTSRTADRVMLKKRSSSQVLPSRSRKLWWRLFLWSHRNLHMPRSARTAHRSFSPGRHDGYTSDTFEEGPAADRKNKTVMVDESPPAASVPNQWVAFCAESSIHDRVSAWVSSIESEPPFDIAEEDDDNYDGEDDEENGECAASQPRHLELGEPSSGKGGNSKSKRCATTADEVVQANTVVQSLNAFSSVAHISGMGLKVVPMIAPFSTLRAVNLSSNLIVHISPGSLPKGLHSLDLSRNKIASVEGLRELTKLRVLNLSYNRISRIGHGLSNCTAIRELYLAGNKISDVEGLHRLLKLAVLDLSFNKITTAKALGQLVANYHSLLALNLVGNPVQANIGDDALRRAVTGLLPSLAYLNKQPVKPQRIAREVATDSIARAALSGSDSRSIRKRTSRRLTQSPRSSSLTRARGGGGGGSPTPRNTSRRR